MHERTLSPERCLPVSAGTGCRGEVFWRGGGGEAKQANFVVTVKAGIRSAGTEQARKECKNDTRERRGRELEMGGAQGLLAP